MPSPPTGPWERRKQARRRPSFFQTPSSMRGKKRHGQTNHSGRCSRSTPERNPPTKPASLVYRHATRSQAWAPHSARPPTQSTVIQSKARATDGGAALAKKVSVHYILTLFHTFSAFLSFLNSLSELLIALSLSFSSSRRSCDVDHEERKGGGRKMSLLFSFDRNRKQSRIHHATPTHLERVLGVGAVDDQLAEVHQSALDQVLARRQQLVLLGLWGCVWVGNVCVFRWIN